MRVWPPALVVVVSLATGLTGGVGWQAPPLVAQEAPTLVPPRVLDAPQPQWPARAPLELGAIEIEARVFIDTTGSVIRVELLDPLDEDTHGFDARAVAWFHGLEFAPATRDGEPIPAEITLTAIFEPPAGDRVSADGDGQNADGMNVDADASASPAPPGAGSSSSGALAVTVVERGTRRPLAGVLVVAERVETSESGGRAGDTQRERWTDATGAAELRGLRPGRWRVTLHPEGYRSLEREESIRAREHLEVRYHVERETYHDDADSWTYETHASSGRREVVSRGLDAGELGAMAGSHGDALKAVRSLPGVGVTAAFDDATVIRGAAPEDSLFVLDGTSIPLAYHFAALASVVDSEILEGIELVPGNFSSRYGRAIGGLVELELASPSERWGGYANVDLAYSAAMAEGPVSDAVRLSFGARRSYFDIVAPLILGSNAGQFDLTLLPTYADYHVRTVIEPDERSRYELAVYGSDDTLEFELETPDPDAPGERGRFHTLRSFHRARIAHAYRGDGWRHRLSYDVGSFRDDVQRGGAMRLAVDSVQHYLREELALEAGRRLEIVVGGDIEVHDADVVARIEDPLARFGQGFETRTTIEVADAFVVAMPALFVETTLEVLPVWDVVFGGRVDFDDERSSATADVRAAMRYRPDESVELSAAVGTFSQPPQLFERAEGVGNPSLAWERALHATVGVAWTMPFYPPLSLEVTGFHKVLDELVVPSAEHVVQDGRTVARRFSNQGEGEVAGLEVLVRHELAHGVFGWLAWTWSGSTRRDAPGEREYRFAHDQPHVLTALLSWQLPSNWRVGARFRYATGRPYTPVEGAVFDADADVWVPIEGARNSARIEDFHQLDVRADKRWIFDSWILGAYVDIQSVYLRANAVEVVYSDDFSETKFFRYIPIIPSLGVEARF